MTRKKENWSDLPDIYPKSNISPSYEKGLELARKIADPKQWLFIKLRQIIEQGRPLLSSKERLKLKNEFKRMETVDSDVLLQLYNLVFPHLNRREREELQEIFKNETRNLRLTPRERKELSLYSRSTGPIISAYLRGKKTVFRQKNSAGMANDFEIDGADKDRMQALYDLNSTNNAGESRPIEEAIKIIERIIYNSPPLPEDIVLFRGINYYKGLFSPKCSEDKCWQIKDMAFISTSLFEGTAYIDNEYFEIIKVPAGTKGVYFGYYVGNYYQQEYLLARGTTLKFESERGMHKEISRQCISCKVHSQEPYIPDNVVDQYKLRTISTDFNGYNDKFNFLKTGVDITEFINTLVTSGLLDKFYDEASDVEELYKRGNGPDVIDHGAEHVQRVMLFSLYLGRNLSEDDINLLITAAKYHDVGVYRGHYGHAAASAQEALNILKTKLSQADVNKIAALIECHEIEDEQASFISVFNKYCVPEEEYQQLLLLVSILKDADALDRTRFRNNLDTRYLRNSESFDLVKTSYQIQEIRGKIDLEEKMRSGYFSQDEINKIKEYLYNRIPYYVISHSLSTYRLWGYDSSDSMINHWLNTPPEHKFRKQ